MFRATWRFINHSTTSLVAAIVFGAIGIYGAFIYDRKPDLTFQVLSTAKVLDIRERLTNLAIVYRGTDLRATNQNLHFVVVRVVNNGSADIIKSSFDTAAPVGFELNLGKIVETPTVTGDEYLRDNIHASVIGERRITFDPVILNSGEAFQVRVLVLVPEGEAIRISAFGKVAGMRVPRVSSEVDASDRRPYLTEAFAGRTSIQLGRTAGYFFGLILCLLIIAALVGVPAVAIAEWLEKRRRRKNVSRYRQGVNRRLTLKEEYLVNQYVQRTLPYERLKALVRVQSPVAELTEEDIRAMGIAVEKDLEEANESADSELVANGLIVRDGPQTQVATDFEGFAREFVNFVAPPTKK